MILLVLMPLFLYFFFIFFCYFCCSCWLCCCCTYVLVLLHICSPSLACLVMVELLPQCILEGMHLSHKLDRKFHFFNAKISIFLMLYEHVVFLLCNRKAIVSSKTKESKKVFTLHLSREALLEKSLSKNSEHTWKVSFSNFAFSLLYFL